MPRTRPPARPVRPEDLTFEQALAILERASEEAKEQLASVSRDADILAYLSRHRSGGVRALVARNVATSQAVDLDLAGDELAEVRIELARKIGRLLPSLSGPAAARLRESTLRVIEKLAEDVLPHVRQVVAEEIKSSLLVPKPVVERLARDAEVSVAAPVLEYSPLLADDDLLEIIATSQVEGVLPAIAKRHGLSSEVSDAVVATLDIPAVAALLANQSAALRAETLDRIAEQAHDIEAWHEPLVLRPGLSIRAIRRISGFVASSLLEVLWKRHDLDDETRHQISVRVRERLQQEPPPRSETDIKGRTWALVTRAFTEQKLDDEFVLEAIRSENGLKVTYALMVLGGVSETVVERILCSGHPQLITALAWHAGLSMRTAFELQKSIAKLAPGDLLPARNGVHFPLTPEQMAGQLELMGVKRKSDERAG